jgi:hypothetical protein
LLEGRVLVQVVDRGFAGFIAHAPTLACGAVIEWALDALTRVE